MDFSAHLDTVLEKILCTDYSAMELISVIDLTLLDKNATTHALEDIAQQALSSQIAAICVYPEHLPFFQNNNSVSLATVINFPNGSEKFEQFKETLEQSVKKKVREIDYVFPYEKFLSGEKKEAYEQTAKLLSFCKDQGLKSKIILETGAFNNLEQLYEAACHIIDLGCDFLKTSTGKIAKGASLSAVFILLSAIKNTQKNCGLKISGGVRTKEQAAKYANLAEMMLNQKINASWFRIGASTLLQDLKQRKPH